MATPSGRPTSASRKRYAAEDRREQLVAIAIDVIAEHGYAKLQVGHIAERAGVTRNLLYRYFPGGRPDVLRAVLDVVAERLTDPSEGDGRPNPALRASNLERITRHALTPTPEWRVYLQAQAVTDPEVQALVAEHHRQWARRVARRNGINLTPWVRSLLLCHRAAVERLYAEATANGYPAELVQRTISQLLDNTLAMASTSDHVQHDRPAGPQVDRGATDGR